MDGMNLEAQHEDPEGMMMMMQMYFEASNKVTILFKQWATTNDWQLVLSCVFWFLIAFFYEGLKSLREFCLTACSPTSQQLRMESDTIDSRVGSKDILFKMVKKCRRPNMEELLLREREFLYDESSTMFTLGHLIQTCLHFVQMLFAYVLMLVVMTYNVWLFFSVILGFTLGYFVFIPGTLVVTRNEHCCG